MTVKRLINLEIITYKIIFISLFFIGPPAFSKISLYDGKEKFEYNCHVKFKEPKEFSCACITGVWRLFSSENCDESRTIGGENFCTDSLELNVSRVERIMDNLEQLFILYKSGTSSVISNSSSSLNIKADEIDTWITASSWTLTSEDGKSSVCLASHENDYCHFSSVDINSIGNITEGCNATDKHISPQVCNDVMIDDTGRNICEKSAVVKTGRVFLQAPGMKTKYVSPGNRTVGEEDEDFFIRVKKLYTFSPPTISDNKILSIVWNSFIKEVDYILKLANSTTEDKQSKYKRGKLVAGFKMLDLCGRIMKVTCPAYYVNPYLIDISIKIFKELLRNDFSYGEYAISFHSIERISEALAKCMNESVPFNFTTDFVCTDKGIPEGDYMSIYGENGTLDILGVSANPTNKEPVIETVWKVFYNAHSSCFNYFDANDHHKFTETLISFFQVPIIYSMWTDDFQITKMALGGLFGDQLVQQTNLAFCAASSRLESQFPWELKRPARARRPRRSATLNDNCVKAPADFPPCKL